MKYTLVYFVASIYFVEAYYFNTDNVVPVYSVNNSDYFGYSLFLQKGDSNGRLIVGAPLDNQNVYFCNINGTNCYKKLFINDQTVRINKETKSPTLLGSVIDGDPNSANFVTCAPRVTKLKATYHIMPGYCMFYKNSRLTSFNILNEQQYIDNYRNIKYYNTAYGLAGFSMQYMQDKILIGAPGWTNWAGKGLSYNMFSNRIESNFFNNRFSTMDSNLGYSVGYGRFTKSKALYYVFGSPRGQSLFGEVLIFSDNSVLVKSLKGSELGAYFGSSIMIYDVTNDGLDDLLVAAPMASGNSYDEGFVNLYISLDNNNLEFASRPAISFQKTGSRFGTTMSKLGDIDLDGYNDVAIGAPYANNGKGIVYIYRGSKDGIIYHQAIEPKNVDVQGFGLGLSNGYDIDNNGYNDLAIGAFKSGQIYLLKTKITIDYKLSLRSNVQSVSEMTKKFVILTCLTYRQKSVKANLRTLDVNIDLSSDYRTNLQLNETVLAENGKQFCKNTTVDINLENNINLSPIPINLKTSISNPNVIVEFNQETSKNLLIPISHGCGSDNICTAKLNIMVYTTISEIILRNHSILEVYILLENVGEPALKTELLIDPKGVKLKNIKNCYEKDKKYVCFISNSFTNTMNLSFPFDVANIEASKKDISINFTTSTVSDIEEGSITQQILDVPIVLVNNPVLAGKSDPDHLDLADKEVKEFSQTFVINNNGPSPIQLEVLLFVPVVSGIKLTSSEISFKDFSNNCKKESLDFTSIKQYDYKKSAALSVKTIFESCVENAECLVIRCFTGYYLEAAAENSVITLNYEADLTNLESDYKTPFLTKDVLLFTSIAKFNDVISHASTSFYPNSTRKLPIWIYIVGALVGILILAILIIVLYKCHFFNRTYKEKLQEEKLLEGQNLNEQSNNIGEEEKE